MQFNQTNKNIGNVNNAISESGNVTQTVIPGPQGSDEVLDEMVRIARRCERVAKLFGSDPIQSMFTRLGNIVSDMTNAWSGSPIGYHANVYRRGLQPRQPGEHFDSHNMGTPLNTSRGEWAEYSYEQVEREIYRRADISDLSAVDSATAEAGVVFEECKEELLPIFDALITEYNDSLVRELRGKVSDLSGFISREDFGNIVIPKGQYMTRDPRAQSQGLLLAPHQIFYCWYMEKASFGSQLNELAKHTMHAVRYLQQRHKMAGKTIGKTNGKIFIGHGRSGAWRDLKDFIQDRLKLEPDEFNREPVAGKSNKERLLEMLDHACFAFLVMTAEDEQPDGKIRARENVVHEAGLFQGRLGFERAIILLEEGCEEFSNVEGLGQIRFPKGKIMAQSEEIRRVLQRERIIL